MDCVWICLHAHKKAKTYSTKIIHNVKERHKLTNRYHDNFSVWFIVLKSLFWPKKKSLCDILSPWLCFIYLWDSFRHDSWSKKKSLSYCFFLNLYSIEYWRVIWFLLGPYRLIPVHDFLHFLLHSETRWSIFFRSLACIKESSLLSNFSSVNNVSFGLCICKGQHVHIYLPLLCILKGNERCYTCFGVVFFIYPNTTSFPRKHAMFQKCKANKIWISFFFVTPSE